MSVPAPSLHARLLGSAWDGLPPVVRHLHQECRATGRFSIRRGAGVVRAMVGWLCGFPSAGEEVPTCLVVRQDGPVQHWERDFGGHALATTQRASEEGLLGERLGPVECTFLLRARESGLVYEQAGAWLCLGRWRLLLPRVLSPRIEATLTAQGERMHVHVRIGSALTGWLLTYEGLVAPEQEPS